MAKISNLCDKLMKGTIVITLTRPIDQRQTWEVL